MARRALPAVFVFAALLSDVGGSHSLSLVLLLAAIPAACVLALDCTGIRPVLAGLAVVLLVLSAALRSPAVVGGVPQFAVSLLVLTLVLYAAISVGALLPGRAVPESA